MFLAKIFADHYGSLSRRTIFWSHVLPLLPIVFLIPIPRVDVPLFRPDVDQISSILTAVSIYSALLFGILIPAGDQAKRLRDEMNELVGHESINTQLRYQRLETHWGVARNILANVSFSIVVSVLNVLSLVIALSLLPPVGGVEPPAYRPFLAISGYLFGLLLFNLLVVVRAVYSSWMADSK